MTIYDRPFDKWKAELTNGTLPIFLSLDKGFEGIRIAPGTIALLGGQSGTGKTALTMQWLFTALERNPKLTALVANVEMSPSDLFNRELSRRSENTLTDIYQKTFQWTRHNAIDEIYEIQQRISFLDAPFEYPNLHAATNAAGPDILILDYLQAFTSDKQSDNKKIIDDIFTNLRRFTNNGGIAIVVSSINPFRSATQSFHEYLDDALIFRGSSTIKHAADQAYVLYRQFTKDQKPQHNLYHIKSRNSALTNLTLDFNGPHQEFTARPYVEFKAEAQSKGKSKNLERSTILMSEEELSILKTPSDQPNGLFGNVTPRGKRK